MIDGLMAPIFILVMFIAIIGPIIAYSVGLAHGRDIEKTIHDKGKPGFTEVDLSRALGIQAGTYSPSKDEEKTMTGENFDYFKD